MSQRPAFSTRPPSRSAGFSLIELMIASTLGLLLMTAIGALFLSTSRNNRENELVSAMQDQARYALATLSRDFAMVGYWGGMLGTSGIVPILDDADADNDSSRAASALLPADDCGPAASSWSFNLVNSLQFRNHDSAASIASFWNCIGNHLSGTDAVALRGVAGQATGELPSGASELSLRPHHFYLQTNGTVGTITRWGSAALGSPDSLEVPDQAPMEFYKFTPRIYFVRDYSLTPGDGVPSLCRKVLCPSTFSGDSDPELSSCGGGSATAVGFVTECLAEGVEDFQITWGIDDPNDSDYLVDQYVADLPDPQQARTARIELLVRSRQANPQYTDSKSYQLGDKSNFTPGAVTDPDGTPATQQTARYYRRLYTTTVRLRNMGIQAGEGVH